MVKKILLSGLLTALFSSTFAMQVVPVKNNAQVKAKIANGDFTRIFVKGDRISDVKGIAGQFNYRLDRKAGQIYIAPTEKYKDQPFNVFLTTENGKNYQMLLLPIPIPADAIELKPPVFKSHVAKIWERETAYVNALTTLIRDMMRGNSPEGYSVNRVKNPTVQRLGSVATLRLVEIYSGDHLRGTVYVIHNLINKPIRLADAQLYRPGARAIALQDEVIPAHGQSRLFMVVSQ